MWASGVLVLLAGVTACRGAEYSAYQYYETEHGDDGADDFYDDFNNDVSKIPTHMTTLEEAFTRIKRYGDPDDIRTLNFEEIKDVKGALKKILNGKGNTVPIPIESQEYVDIYDYIDTNNIEDRAQRNFSDVETHGLLQNWIPVQDEPMRRWPPRVEAQNLPLSDENQNWLLSREAETWASTRHEAQTWTLSKDEGETWTFVRDESERWTPARHQTQTRLSSEDKIQSPTIKVQHRSPTVDVQSWRPIEETQETLPDTLSWTYENDEVKSEVQKLITSKEPVRKSSPFDEEVYNKDSHVEDQPLTPTTEVQSWTLIDDTGETVIKTRTYSDEEIKAEMAKLTASETATFQELNTTIRVQHWSLITALNSNAVFDTDLTLSNPEDGDATTPFITTTTQRVKTQLPSKPRIQGPTTKQSSKKPIIRGPTTQQSSKRPTLQGIIRKGDDGTTKPTTTTKTTTTKTTPPSTTSSPRMDIDAIIAIIANLTYDYDWNLTEQFNKTLIDHGVPTCPTESTLTTTTTTPSPYDFSNSSVVSKCFVCGLKELEIPRTAFCADAFAGDFLPLVPTDPRARGKIATYRKYCRYLDVHNYVENPLESRSIYGRFTGGCGVRWTDLTGIYTQRTCRARFRPMMGKHFASKRMAKLELALVNVENGCIISPMASLLPLSRGISLYARFHACVCTGSWCNRARMRTRTLRTAILFYWLAFMASILV